MRLGIIERAVILAGGLGARLEPYTQLLPKPLLPVGHLPILEVALRQLRTAGVRHVTLAVGHMGSLIEAYFGDGRNLGLKITYSREQSPLGTAGPVRLIDDLSDTFILMNGDLLTDMNYADLNLFHRERRAVATVATYRRQERIDLGVLDIDSEGLVTGYREKPIFEFSVSMGIYVLDPRVLQFIQHGVAMDLPTLVRTLIAEGERVVAYPFSGVWLDIGRSDDYAEAQRRFKEEPGRFLGQLS